MAQFVKVGTREDFALEGGSSSRLGDKRLLFSIWVAPTTRSTIPVRIEAGLWQKVWSRATWLPAPGTALSTPSRQAPSSARLHRGV